MLVAECEESGGVTVCATATGILKLHSINQVKSCHISAPEISSNDANHPFRGRWNDIALIDNSPWLAYHSTCIPLCVAHAGQNAQQLVEQVGRDKGGRPEWVVGW